ncbi:MAG: hypothetical protein ACJ764_12215 [Solirubrobacteraceae bacterium]
MRTKRRATIENLRTAIESLPRTTRVAMLQGIASNEIIVGAYTDGHGICPMLAAHRAGGRTNLISFAKAWDRFALAGARVTKARPATARELLVLRTHLEASLLEEDAPVTDLACAIREHRELVRRHDQEGPRDRGADRQVGRQGARPGDSDRSQELRSQPGWSWMRLVRRYDEYQWALEQVEAHQQAEEEAPVLN